MYKDQKDPCGPVYVVIGDGGNVEGPYRNYMDERACPGLFFCLLFPYFHLSFYLFCARPGIDGGNVEGPCRNYMDELAHLPLARLNVNTWAESNRLALRLAATKGVGARGPVLGAPSSASFPAAVGTPLPYPPTLLRG